MQETTYHPRISIGLPVFNGENYIEEAIDSILNQTYSDFELIIVDNASCDRTQQICHEYEKKDKRIHYYRNKKNLGAVENYNRTVRYASGEYFKWAAHDDVLLPDFLSECVKVLDTDPSVALCQTKTRCVDGDGNFLGVYSYKLNFDSDKPHQRFGELVLKRYQDDSWLFIFGLMRTALLKKTSLQGRYVGSDINLLAEISLLGKLHTIPKILFLRRSHPNALSNLVVAKKMNHSEEIVWWLGQSKVNLMWSRICLEYCKSVIRTRLKTSERLRCYSKILKWILKNGWISMLDEWIDFYLNRSKLGIKFAPFVKQLRMKLALKRQVYEYYNLKTF